MKKLFFIVLVAASLVSCNKNKPTQLQSDMIGHWEEVSHTLNGLDANDGQGTGVTTGDLTITTETITDVGNTLNAEYTLDGNTISYNTMADGIITYTVSVSGNSMTFSWTNETRVFERQ